MEYFLKNARTNQWTQQALSFIWNSLDKIYRTPLIIKSKIFVGWFLDENPEIKTLKEKCLLPQSWNSVIEKRAQQNIKQFIHFIELRSSVFNVKHYTWYFHFYFSWNKETDFILLLKKYVFWKYVLPLESLIFCHSESIITLIQVM